MIKEKPPDSHGLPGERAMAADEHKLIPDQPQQQDFWLLCSRQSRRNCRLLPTMPAHCREYFVLCRQKNHCLQISSVLMWILALGSCWREHFLLPPPPLCVPEKGHKVARKGQELLLALSSSEGESCLLPFRSLLRLYFSPGWQMKSNPIL